MFRKLAVAAIAAIALIGLSANKCEVKVDKEAVEAVKEKLEETGVKTHCEGRTTQDACSIDQRCQWVEDACKDR